MSPLGTVGIWGQIILSCGRCLTASLTILQWHPGSLLLVTTKTSADITKLFLIESYCVKAKEKILAEVGQYRAFGLKLCFLFDKVSFPSMPPTGHLCPPLTVPFILSSANWSNLSISKDLSRYENFLNGS